MVTADTQAHRKAKIIGWVLSLITLLIGLSLLLPNFEYLKYTSFLGEDIVNEFQEYVEWGFMRDTDGLEIIQKKGNTAVIGIVIMAFSAVIWVLSRLVSNSYLVTENSRMQTHLQEDILHTAKSQRSDSGSSNPAERLKHLEELLDQKLITKEEFDKKRLDILNNL